MILLTFLKPWLTVNMYLQKSSKVLWIWADFLFAFLSTLFFDETVVITQLLAFLL